MKRIAVPCLAICLAACSTMPFDASIDYSLWKPNSSAPVPSTALRFRLPESTITLSQQPASSPGAQGNLAQSPGAGGNTAGQSKIQTAANCSGGSGQVTSNNWWQCFAQASAQSTPPASDLAAPDALVYVAKPDNPALSFSTSAISGTAITGQDGLYSVVTVNYTNNTAAIITAAGAGAATGFGIAGPYGAAAGFLFGSIGSALHPAAAPLGPKVQPAPKPPPQIMSYICPGEPVDLSNIQNLTPPLSPLIAFPIAIANTNVGGLAPSSELTAVNKPAPVVAGTPNACWHTLPNKIAGGPTAISQTGSKPIRRNLLPGDGWLYRIVAKDADLTKRPTSADVSVADYFGANFATNPRHDFPYSSCRKVTLQIIWWAALEDAIESNPAQPNPNILPYDVTIADPRFVSIADVTKGGVVNFRPDCGANVTTAPDASAAAILNASVTSAESIYKAEQTWASAQKK